MEEKKLNYRTGRDVLVKMSTIGAGSVIDNDSIVLKSVIGETVDIEKRNLIRAAKIGDMTYTGSDCSIMWAEVGKFCSISRLVDIGGNQHNYRAASMMPDYRFRNKMTGTLKKHPDEEPVIVGNDVWIGQGVSIVRKAGLVIGDGAVIGSGAVVTSSIPPYAIAAGVPARVIKYRFSPEIIEKLLELRWWDWSKEKIVENWDRLSADLTEEIVDELLSQTEKSL